MPDGNWITSFTGKKIYPLNLTQDQICIEDIAHALSLICRFGGHCRKFYSVAEHSINVAKVIEDSRNSYLALKPPVVEFMKWGLLHDASEAYLVDVPRPLKAYLTGYKEAELKCEDVIAQKFGLYPHYMPGYIKFIDISVLYREAEMLMPNGPNSWEIVDRMDLPELKLQFLSPEKAEKLFLGMYCDLFSKRSM